MIVLVLNAYNDGATYQWHDLSTEPGFTAKQEGTYFVVAYLNGCRDADAIDIDYDTLPEVKFHPDTFLCMEIHCCWMLEI